MYELLALDLVALKSVLRLLHLKTCISRS